MHTNAIVGTASALTTWLLASAAAAQSASPAVFVANNGNLEGSVSSFIVNAGGSLTFKQKLVLGQVPSSSQFDPGLNAYSISLSPNGRFLAIGHATASTTVERISIVEVHADASLSLYATDDTPDSPLDLKWIADDALAVTRTSTSLANLVYVYRFNPALPSGQILQQIDSEPTGSFTTALASTPDRAYLFANDSTQNKVTAFSRNPDGTITQVAVRSTQPNYPLGIGCTSDGRFVYGGGGISGDGKRVVGLSFDQATHTLDVIPGSPFASPGSSPKLVAVSEDQSLAFVGHGTDATIRVFAINQSSGALSDTGFSYDVGFQGTLGDIAVLGGRMYVSDNSTIFDNVKGVRSFDIGSDGALVEIGTIVDSNGVAPTALDVWSPIAATFGDLDGDGAVGASDLAILLGAWGACGLRCPADLDGDGTVSASDLSLLLGAWT